MHVKRAHPRPCPRATSQGERRDAGKAQVAAASHLVEERGHVGIGADVPEPFQQQLLAGRGLGLDLDKPDVAGVEHVHDVAPVVERDHEAVVTRVVGDGVLDAVRAWRGPDRTAVVRDSVGVVSAHGGRLWQQRGIKHVMVATGVAMAMVWHEVTHGCKPSQQ